MRVGKSITVTLSGRARLKALVGDRNTRQKHVWRADTMLARTDGAHDVEIAWRTGKPRTSVRRGQVRFAEGVEGREMTERAMA